MSAAVRRARQPSSRYVAAARLYHQHVGTVHDVGEAARYAAGYLAAKGYADLGDAFDRDDARLGYAVALRKAAACLAERPGTSVVTAGMYAFAGDKELAHQWLEEACQDGDSTMVYLKVDPSFDTLRDASRFQTLLRTMSFPP